MPLPDQIPPLRPPLQLRRLGAVLGTLLAVGISSFYARRWFSAPTPPSTAILKDLSLVRRDGGTFVSDPAALVRVPVLATVDGDTLRVRWEGKDTRLRYYGVDTPEVGEACHDEAAARNAALAGREVLLAFDERPRDKYDRLLAYVFTAEGKSMDAALVEEGFGRAWTRDGRWRDGMETLEKDARAAKRGCLWSRPRSAPRRGKPAHGKRRPR